MTLEKINLNGLNQKKKKIYKKKKLSHGKKGERQ